MTDDETPGPAEPAPTPESPPPTTPQGSGPVRPLGRMVRIGCAILGVLGVLAVILGGFSALNPEQGVCAQAVSRLEDAVDDDEQVDVDPDDVDCGDTDERAAAIAEAERIDDDDLRSEGTYRVQGLFSGLVGLTLAVGSLLTLRRPTRANRRILIVGAALGVLVIGLAIFPVILILLGFGIYAILYSADARATFGDTGSRLFRPRPRGGAPGGASGEAPGGPGPGPGS